MDEQKRFPVDLTDEDRSLIRDMAEGVAQNYGLDVERVHAVYQRLAFVLPEPPFPLVRPPRGSAGNRVRTSAAFQQAATALGPAKALELFERTDPLVLHRRWALVRHLRHPIVPFLTLDELAGSMDAFIQYRRVNRDCVIRTGWPGTSFARSPWLDWHLSPLYPTRIPARVFDITAVFTDPEGPRLSRDEAGNIIYADSYRWSAEPDPDLEPERSLILPGGDALATGTQTCRYEEAALLPGLTGDLAAFLEEHRDEFLRLQLDVVAACTDAVRAGDADRLWPAVLSLLTGRLSIEQLWQFLQADALYREIRLLPVMAIRCNTMLPENFSGGLTDLLRLVAHCEKEIRHGLMDQTRRRLLRAPEDLAGTGCYFQAVGHPAVALLDHILDEYWDRQPQEARFWHEFGERVRRALEEEADREEVRVTKRVDKSVAPLLQEALLDFIEGFPSLLRSLGGSVVVQFAPSTSIDRRAAVYSLRKGGPYWIAQFEDEVAVFKDNEIARLVAFLIRNQGERFHVIHAVLGGAGKLAADDAVPGQRSTRALLAEEGVPGRRPEPQPIADAVAVKGLEQMIERTKAERAEAESRNDVKRALELKEELAEWEQHLRSIKGKGGKARDFSDDASTAQKRLSEAFRRLCGALNTDAPKFVRHLQNSVYIKMSDCSYRPDHLIPWET